jgi:hypothetical protein
VIEAAGAILSRMLTYCGLQFVQEPKLRLHVILQVELQSCWKL